MAFWNNLLNKITDTGDRLGLNQPDLMKYLVGPSGMKGLGALSERYLEPLFMDKPLNMSIPERPTGILNEKESNLLGPYNVNPWMNQPFSRNEMNYLEDLNNQYYRQGFVPTSSSLSNVKFTPGSQFSPYSRNSLFSAYY